MASKAITAQGTIIRGVVEKTLSVEFAAGTKKLIRTTGSWIEDKFAVGMDITSNDGSNATLGKATVVTALEMTVDGTVSSVAAASKTVTGKAEIGEIQNFTGPGGQSADIDVTTLRSTAKEYRRGLQDEGEITFECNLDPADVGQLFCRNARAETASPFGQREFEVVLQDADQTQFSFSAFVKGFSIAGSVDDVVTASLALRITGAVTWE